MRNFDTHHRFPRYRRHYPHTDRLHYQRQIILEADNFVDFYPGGRSKLIHGNDRAGQHLHHFPFNAKFSQLLFEKPCLDRQFLGTVPALRCHWDIEEIKRRQCFCNMLLV